MLRSVFIIFCVVLISACSQQTIMRLYEGPSLGTENEATLMLPLNFKILSLDDAVISDNRQKFRNQAITIQLSPGAHELILQYEDLWEIDSDNHQMIRSGPLVFSLHLQANERLVIEHAPLLNLSQAQAFATSPKVILASEFQRSKASHLKKENPLTFNEASEVKKIEKPVLKQLQFWWAQASDIEKKSFIQWQSNNP